jgi:hypothetical protein
MDIWQNSDPVRNRPTGIVLPGAFFRHIVDPCLAVTSLF